uniref:Uncharacterized protein n=1 Tax=Tetranychus urticae TaxID=32264 RepID=T1KY00_TETUR
MAEKSKIFCCTKYTLMACNAFGIMLGIFVVLFGMSYPEERFPGGYRGKTTAAISIVMIFFTLIGYCGAHHQKAYFLIIYSIIIVLFVVSNVATFFVLPEHSLFNLEGKTFWILTMVLGCVLAFACLFAYQVRTRSNSSSTTTTTTTTTGLGQFTLPNGGAIIVKTNGPPNSANSTSSATSFISVPRFTPIQPPY